MDWLFCLFGNTGLCDCLLWHGDPFDLPTGGIEMVFQCTLSKPWEQWPALKSSQLCLICSCFKRSGQPAPSAASGLCWQMICGANFIPLGLQTCAQYRGNFPMLGGRFTWSEQLVELSTVKCHNYFFSLNHCNRINHAFTAGLKSIFFGSTWHNFGGSVHDLPVISTPFLAESADRPFQLCLKIPPKSG